MNGEGNNVFRRKSTNQCQISGCSLEWSLSFFISFSVKFLERVASFAVIVGQNHLALESLPNFCAALGNVDSSGLFEIIFFSDCSDTLPVTLLASYFSSFCQGFVFLWSLLWHPLGLMLGPLLILCFLRQWLLERWLLLLSADFPDVVFLKQISFQKSTTIFQWLTGHFY